MPFTILEFDKSRFVISFSSSEHLALDSFFENVI